MTFDGEGDELVVHGGDGGVVLREFLSGGTCSFFSEGSDGSVGRRLDDGDVDCELVSGRQIECDVRSASLTRFVGVEVGLGCGLDSVASGDGTEGIANVVVSFIIVHLLDFLT